jgi:hypothetical protein
MARPHGPCKAPKRRIPAIFPKNTGYFLPIRVFRRYPRAKLAAYGAVAQNPRIYILLCMFNGFAFARPFCGAIKGKSDGG